MPKHENKYCPKCGVQFECKVGSILLCQCSAVSLTEKEIDFIGHDYDDCLCANCMKKLKADYQNQRLEDQKKRILGVFYKKQEMD